MADSLTITCTGDAEFEIKITNAAAEMVGLSFNPSGLDDVTRIKALAAALLTVCDKGDVRCASLAKMNVEQGAMWAVKAVTKPAP